MVIDVFIDILKRQFIFRFEEFGVLGRRVSVTLGRPVTGQVNRDAARFPRTEMVWSASDATSVAVQRASTRRAGVSVQERGLLHGESGCTSGLLTDSINSE